MRVLKGKILITVPNWSNPPPKDQIFVLEMEVSNLSGIWYTTLFEKDDSFVPQWII